MSNKFVAKTYGTVGEATAEWSVDIEDPMLALAYQNYANTLFAAVVAKLGDFIVESALDNQKFSADAKAFVKKINDL